MIIARCFFHLKGAVKRWVSIRKVGDTAYKAVVKNFLFASLDALQKASDPAHAIAIISFIRHLLVSPKIGYRDVCV